MAVCCKLSLIVPAMRTPGTLQSASAACVDTVLSPMSIGASTLTSVLGATLRGNGGELVSERPERTAVLFSASVMFTEPIVTVLESLARGPSTKRSWKEPDTVEPSTLEAIVEGAQPLLGPGVRGNREDHGARQNMLIELHADAAMSGRKWSVPGG